MAKITFQEVGSATRTDARNHFYAQFEKTIRSVVSWSKWQFAPHVRDDLVQQISVELVKSDGALARSRSPEKFVRVICVRRCIDEVRRQFRQRTHFVSLDCPPPEEDAAGGSAEREFPAGDEWDPIRAIQRAERAALLTQSVGKLDPTCQDAIHDFYAARLSYKQIAEKLGLSINTVGSRLSKCLDKLKTLIQDDPELEEELSVPFD